jgi:hypothetical protein
MTVPLPEQAAEVERELRQRERLYPRWIAEGRIKADTAATKVRNLQAAATTLRFMAGHAEGLRTIVGQLRTNGAEPTPEERAALLAHPAVQAVLDAWPDAEALGIRPITQPSPDGDPTEERQEACEA